MYSTTKEEYFKLHNTVNVLDGFVAEFVREEQNVKDMVMHENITNAIQQKKLELHNLSTKVDNTTNIDINKKEELGCDNSCNNNNNNNNLSMSPRLTVIELLRRYLLKLQSGKEQWHQRHPYIIFMFDDSNDNNNITSQEENMKTNPHSSDYYNNFANSSQHYEQREQEQNHEEIKKEIHHNNNIASLWTSINEIVNVLRERLQLPLCTIEPINATLHEMRTACRECNAMETNALLNDTTRKNNNSSDYNDAVTPTSEVDYMLAEHDEKMGKQLHQIRTNLITDVLDKIKQFDLLQTLPTAKESHVAVSPVILFATEWPRSIADAVTLIHELDTPTVVIYFTTTTKSTGKAHNNDKTSTVQKSYSNTVNADLLHNNLNLASDKKSNKSEIKTLLRAANREALLNGQSTREKNALLEYYRALGVLHEVNANSYTQEEVIKHILHTLNI